MEEKKILCEQVNICEGSIDTDKESLEITPSQATYIHNTLSKDDVELELNELRNELIADGDSGVVRVNINPLTGEQEGEPELNDDDIEAILYSAAGGRQAFPESYKLILKSILDMSDEDILEFEKIVISLDHKKPISEQMTVDIVNKYIQDSTVTPKDGETILDAKYSYIQALKQICMFDIDNMDMGDMFDKALLATQEKYGVATSQLAAMATEKVAARIAKLEATGKNKYLINSLKAKQKVLNTKFTLESIDELFRDRAKYLARDYMSDKALKKEIVKFEQLVYASNIKLDSIEYFSAALDCIVSNTNDVRLTMYQIRKVLYMLIRAATTRTTDAPLVIATLGWFIKVLYKNTHALTTILKENKDGIVPDEIKTFGIDVYNLIAKYI